MNRSTVYRGALLFCLALISCGGKGSGSAPGTTTTTPAPTAAATETATSTATETATSTATEAPTATATATAAPKDADYDPLNKAKPPTDSEELQSRARGLFDAVVQNNPTLGEDFWFPKEPFLILKDIKDPGKYWDQLHRAYVKDIEKLHKKRASWDGCEFSKFEPGSPPKWVKPGEEGNKIGYFRTVKGNLVYKEGGKSHKLEVRVIISWQKRWYITHLGKFK
ncbi:MAG: hypothetical protein U0441_33745 [Polyangiaceae bacterium]